MKTTSAAISLNNPGAVLGALRAHMAEHDIEIRDRDDAAVAQFHAGEATLRAEDRMLKVEARAQDQSRLEELAGFLASHVLEFAHPEKPSIEWSDLAAGNTFSDFREIVVTGVADLSRHMRRISFRGDDLARFATDANLHVRLFFPPPGTVPVWPTRGSNGLAQAIPPEQKPLVRKYTIRRIDAAAGTLDIDFVLHDIPGPGSDWARSARLGARIGMAGPGGRGAKQADWLLLAGDETALPAIARILEEMPADAQGTAIILVEDRSDEIVLSVPKDVEIVWLHRSAGNLSLASAVCAVDVPQGVSRFCWAGGEFSDIQAIRRHWQAEVGLTKEEQLAVSYWRHGQAEG